MEVFLTGSSWDVGVGYVFEVVLYAHPSIRLSEEETLDSKLGAVAEAAVVGFLNLLSNAEPSTSDQMRLLLAKQGSSLPLYLHLVTDYLRLFTLYEQVSCSLATKS